MKQRAKFLIWFLVLAAVLAPLSARALDAGSIPTKIPTPWGASAGGSYIRPIPVPSQIGVQNGAASFTDGFPPLTFLPSGAGGVPPFGQDFNGIFNILSLWTKWYNAGGPIFYDATFQSNVGGYPRGSIVQSTVTTGLLWISLVDNNASNPDAGGANWQIFQTSVLPGTGAQLQYNSGSQISLASRGGGWLWINGFNYLVSAPTLSNSGLGNNATLYVYAFISGGNVAIEAVATGYTANSGNGIPQKAGDPTRTLVGLLQTTASGQFNQPQVISYYQRRNLTASTGTFVGTTASATPVELNSAFRALFCTWGDEVTTGTIFASGRNSLAGDGGIVSYFADELGQTSAAGQFTSSVAGTSQTTAATGSTNLADGCHRGEIYGAAFSGGTATFIPVLVINYRG